MVIMRRTLTPIGEWLLDRRAALGLNQRELAELVDMSDTTIGEISYGDTPFNLDHAEKLAAATNANGLPLLGVTAETLLRIAGRLLATDYQHDVVAITEASASLPQEDRAQVLDYILMLKRRSVGVRDETASKNPKSRPKANHR